MTDAVMDAFGHSLIAFVKMYYFSHWPYSTTLQYNIISTRCQYFCVNENHLAVNEHWTYRSLSFLWHFGILKRSYEML